MLTLLCSAVVGRELSSYDEETGSAGDTCQISEPGLRLGGRARVRYGDTDIAYMNLGCNITTAARSISVLGAENE